MAFYKGINLAESTEIQRTERLFVCRAIASHQIIADQSSHTDSEKLASALPEYER